MIHSCKHLAYCSFRGPPACECHICKIICNSGKLLNLLWANILFKILDISTTIYSVKQNGTDAEFNPFVKSIIDAVGFYPTMFIIAAAHCGLIYFLYRKAKVGLLKIVGIITLGFVLINLIDILIKHII